MKIATIDLRSVFGEVLKENVAGKRKVTFDLKFSLQTRKRQDSGDHRGYIIEALSVV